MDLTIMGCSGSVSADLRTTCLMLDEDTLIDCGTGAGDLDLAAMVNIDRVFLTHSHLDHVAMLPLLADSAGSFRDSPLTVYALAETIATLKSHIFNSFIWPDYTVQPTPERPYIQFEALESGQAVVCEGRKITALPARHAVPAVGYLVDSGKSAFAFSGDTTLCDEFWDALNQVGNLNYLMIEATFLDSNRARAKLSGHMTPSLLAEGLKRLKRPPGILITHMESGREEETMKEILALCKAFEPRAVKRGDVFEL